MGVLFKDRFQVANLDGVLNAHRQGKKNSFIMMRIFNKSKRKPHIDLYTLYFDIAAISKENGKKYYYCMESFCFMIAFH